MNDLFGYRIDTEMKITELQREFDRRRSIYNGQIKRGYLGLRDAQHRLAVLQAVINDYKKITNTPLQPQSQPEPDISQCHMSLSAKEALAEIRKTLEG